MKVLVIAHLLPGDAEPGGARIEWLARALAPFGAEVRLLALRGRGVRRAEGASEPDLSTMTVVDCPTSDLPGQISALLRGDGGFARTVLDHPSQVEAVRRGVEIAVRFLPDVILSSIPPRRVGEVAYRIALETGLPWVVDWQDPIALHPLNVWPSRGYYRAHMERERLWARRAALHVVTAPSCGRMMEKAYPSIRTALVTNGWGGERAVSARAERGRLLYTGSLTPDLYGFAARFPWKLSMRLRSRLTFGRLCHAPFAGVVDYRPWGLRALEVIARCREAIGALEFEGARHARVAMANVRRLGLGGVARTIPWTCPQRATESLARAHVLWLCRCGTGKAAGEPVVMSKAAYYLASGRPIFAVLPPECDTADMLRGHAGVFMADPGNPDALGRALGRALSTAPEASFDRDVDDLRWGRLAERLVGLLESVASGRPAGNAGEDVPATDEANGREAERGA